MGREPRRVAPPHGSTERGCSGEVERLTVHRRIVLAPRLEVVDVAEKPCGRAELLANVFAPTGGTEEPKSIVAGGLAVAHRDIEAGAALWTAGGDLCIEPQGHGDTDGLEGAVSIAADGCFTA